MLSLIEKFLIELV